MGEVLGTQLAQQRETLGTEIEAPTTVSELAESLKPKLDLPDRARLEAAFGKPLNAESVATLTYGEMMDAEKKEGGALGAIFGTKLDTGQNMENGHEPVTLNARHKVGDKILFNSQGNTTAYHEVGAGDLLSEHVRKVKITAPNGTVRTSNRRSGLKGGFYDAKDYIAVFDNYTIEVLEVWSDSDLKGNRERLVVEEREFQSTFAIRLGLDPATTSPRELRRMEVEAGKFADVMQKRPKWHDYMREAMQHFGVPPEAEGIFWAMMRNESRFNPRARNKKTNALGLFQFMPRTGEAMMGYLRDEGLTEFSDFRSIEDTLSQLGSDLQGPGVKAQIFGTVAYSVRSMRGANRLIDKYNLPESYKLSFSGDPGLNAMKFYLAGHEGPAGYPALMKFFHENGGFGAKFDRENFEKAQLVGTQRKRGYPHLNKVIAYAAQAGRVASSYKPVLESLTV